MEEEGLLEKLKYPISMMILLPLSAFTLYMGISSILLIVIF